jgi:hypothetical protein
MCLQPKLKLFVHNYCVLVFFICLLVSSISILKGSNTITNITQSPICLGQGQYGQTVKFRAAKGAKWKVFESYNAFDSLSQSANPIFLPNNVLLRETPFNATESVYSIYCTYHSGTKYVINFIDKYGTYYNVEGGGQKYQDFLISGKNAVCLSSAEAYTAPPYSLGYKILVVGGNIIQSNVDSSIVSVAWSAVPGRYSITFKRKGAFDCYNQAIKQVAVGSSSSAIACKANLQISLDYDCDFEVTPQLLSANPISNSDAFAVVLMKDNIVLPGNKLDYDHIGKSITAKLIQGCSQNSCWSTLKIEDKTPPKILCRDTLVVNCFSNIYPKPIAIDNCDFINKTVLIDSSVINAACNDIYGAFISTKYTSKDLAGNLSKTCRQVIALKRVPLDSILFPKDFTYGSALSCTGFKKDAYGMPSPDVTGYPNYNCTNIYLNYGQLCNVYASYSDTKIGHIGCTEKIMRKWRLVEWRCDSSYIITRNQLIHIIDDVAPLIKCPKPKSVTTDNQNCTANVNFDPIIEVKDECSTSFTYSVAYTGGLTSVNGGSGILKGGNYNLVYTVSDQCGNSSTCTTTLNVLDLSAPIVVCKKNVTVGISTIGSGHIFPSSIDDGSYDFCGLDSFRIRRLDDTLGFGETVWFDCDDVSKDIMVELKVWNKATLANSCMINVLVQDKTPPSIACPKNHTVSCETIYDLKNLKFYGEATGYDACDFTIKESVIEKINQCRIGSIERIFTIYDKQDSAKCSSFIYFTKTDTEFSVKWPKDYAVKDSCSLLNLAPDKLPNGYNKPIINEEGICDLFGTNYKDEYFTIDEGNGSCFKIIRTWTVLDYCRMNEPEYEPSVYQQIIKISNTIDPIMKLDVDSIACTLDNECDKGKIKLKASAIDDCTPSDKLEWTYQIDFNFNGTFKADLIKKLKGISIDASDNFPIGKHQIIFTVEDKCGNKVSRLHNFQIKNCKAPSPVCISNFSITLNQMTVNGQNVRMACVNAVSLNASSSHFCGLPLKYSFSRDTKDTTKCFTCTDLGINQLPLYVTDINGNFASCIVAADVQKNDNSGLTLTASKASICNGESVTLSVVGNNMIVNNYLWSTGATAASITVAPGSTATYTVSVNTNEACVLSKSVTITVLPKIDVLINGNGVTVQNICAGDTTSLTATGGLSYSWSNNQTTASIKVNPLVNTIYTVTVTDANGCTASASKTVALNPRPQASIASPSNNVCPGEAITLVAAGGTSYNWSNGIGIASNTITPPINTIYTVTVTTNGCSSIVSKEITLKQAPSILITGDLSVCAGSPASLLGSNTQSSSGNTYVWSSGQTTPNIVVTPNAAGNQSYLVTVTNSVGCTGVQSVILNVNPLPIVTISPENPGVCPGFGAVLIASGGVSYNWNTIPTQSTASITVNPLTPTSYTVTVTSTQGCSSTSSKQVVVSSIPSASITAGSATICQGSSTLLTATGGVTYAWNTDPVQTSAAITVSPSTTTTFIVTVTNSNSCTNTATQTITVLSTNFANIAPLTVPKICIGASATLTASGGGTYLWSNNATTASITVSPTENTTYTVTVTNNGCTSTASRLVEVEPLPVALITGNLSICVGGFTTLTATNLVNPNGNIYTWSNGAVTPSITVAPATTSIYTVTILNSGCGGMNNIVSATVTVNPPITASVAGPTQICQGQSATLTASGGVTYRWNTTPQQTTASITVSPITNTQYTVTVTASPGCTAIVNTTIAVLPKPIITLSGDTNICPGTSTTLTATNTSTMTTGTNTYLWNTTPTQSTQSITVSPSSTTTFTVTVTNINGCSDIKSIIVEVNPLLNPIDIACKNITIPITSLGTVSIVSSSLIELPGLPCDIEKYKFAFSNSIINDSIRVFNCDSIGERKVKVFFYFNGVPLNDSCIATINITDPPSPGNPNGFCTNNIFKVTGKVITENAVPVSDVDVNLVNIDMQPTNNLGQYSFPEMKAAANYIVEPIKDKEYLDGVSTLDLILIQRHILGAAKLNSPYKMIAADINNDNKITVADIVELRKMILSTQTKFSKNRSWKMVNASYEFPDPSNPFNTEYQLYHEFLNPSGSYDADFIGVKIGDVNTSYVSVDKDKYSDGITIEITNERVTNFESSTDVSINGLNFIDGLQLEFDVSNFYDVNVTSSVLSKDEFHFSDLGGKLRVIIAAKTAIANTGQKLFTVHGKVFGNNASIFKLAESGIKNEIYGDNQVFKAISKEHESEKASFKLLPNGPNPWNDFTNICFELPKDGEVKVIVKDVQNKILFNKYIKGFEGKNKFELNKSDIGNVGNILIYELVYLDQRKCGKMIYLE